jgi:hypothetical protein
VSHCSQILNSCAPELSCGIIVGLQGSGFSIMENRKRGHQSTPTLVLPSEITPKQEHKL